MHDSVVGGGPQTAKTTSSFALFSGQTSTFLKRRQRIAKLQALCFLLLRFSAHGVFKLLHTMREVFEDGAAGERRLGRIVACVITRLDPCADAFDDAFLHIAMQGSLFQAQESISDTTCICSARSIKFPDGTNLYTNDSTSDTWIHWNILQETATLFSVRGHWLPRCHSTASPTLSKIQTQAWQPM